jgi:phosphopantetheine--protein transferase-like protein
LIGNDIVDLQYVDSPSYQHVRFLDRICTSEETLQVRQALEPQKTLAAIWAAKEAAYKLFSKRSAHCYFVPRQFVTRSANGAQEFFVTYESAAALVSVTATENCVHAVATWPEDLATRITRVAIRETSRCVRGGRRASNESEAVRFLAAELLDVCSEREVVLEFARRVPRLRWKNGENCELDISLSHDGAFAAVAISGPASRGSFEGQWNPAASTAPNREGMCSTFTA